MAKLIVALGLVLCLGACMWFVLAPSSSGSAPSPLREVPAANETQTAPEDRYFSNGGLTSWWDRDQLPGQSSLQLTKLSHSNIHPQDYSGAESCKKCHAKNYAAWSTHPHRWMNAEASTETVKGDFSGVSISYLGGEARFVTAADGAYRMLFSRDGVRREYAIAQTIGSRFFQYYVGTLLQGPEPPEHPAYEIPHVMLFGYWLDRQEWVPAVHIGYDEMPDGRREDPFARDLPPTPLSPYYQCNSCHTTFALGDELARNFYSLGRHAPHPLHFHMSDYLRGVRPEIMPDKSSREFGNPEVESLLIGMQQFQAKDHAVTLGVTCEACHLGCQQHAQGKQEKPSFFPASPHLNVDAESLTTGRDHDNVNWACGRCHAGERPYYAGGMSTWNSTEFTDASKGGCYSQLTCVHCHNPHEATGSRWQRTPAENDELCLACHKALAEPAKRSQHTHHAEGSAGSHCMDCHMPRINEGLQDVVRTHTIYSPTQAEMLENNELNACNICHVDQPIDWTLKYLKDWYGKTYAADKIAAAYPRRDQATILGWLQHPREAVRLAATDAMARSQDTTALPAWIDVLNDPFLLNRQFARVAIEKRFSVKLDDFGYRFYMTPQERQEPIARIRQRLLSPTQ